MGEEEDYRRAYEAARRRRQQEERQRYFGFDSEDEETEPRFRLVRGIDGNLYKIRNEPTRLQSSQYDSSYVDENDNESESEDIFRLVQGRDGNIYKIKIGENKMNEEPKRSQNVASKKLIDPVTSAVNDEISNKNEDSLKASLQKAEKKKLKRRVTIIVEDASDSEAEEDEQKSVWRNRRPSPGEWMEPVENFN